MPPDRAAYARAHRAAVLVVRQRVQAYVASAWGSMRAWRQSDVERFVAQVVPVVLAGQGNAAQLTNAYLATVAAAVTGQPARLAGLRTALVSGAAVRNGTPPADVYRRSGVTVWRALGTGLALDAAVRLGERRALVAAATDIQLAVTHTSALVLGRDARVKGYRRTLGGSKSCALCISESARLYKAGDLLPIHPGCSCGIEPEYGGAPVSEMDVLSEEMRAADVEVREHGELGPMLTNAKHSFTSEDDF